MKKLSLYITLALVSLFLGACSGEYEPWGNPQSYSEEGSITIPGIKANAVATQDLANAGEKVSLFTLTTAELPDGYTLQNARIQLYPEDLDGATATTINTTIEGMATKTEVQAMVEKYFGKRPVARKFKAHVFLNTVKDGQAALIDAGTIAVTVIPDAPFIDSAYYLITDASSWSKNNAKVFSHSDADVYKDPVFTLFITTTAPNTRWKIVTKTNYDGDLLAEGKTGVLGTTVKDDTSMEGTLTTTNPQAGMIKNAGMYRITINMLTYTYKIEKLNFTEFLYMAGDANSWSHSDILHGPAFDGKYHGYMYLTQNGFKFSTQPNWNGTNYGKGFSTDGGADNIMMTEPNGFYKVELDLQALSYKLTPITTIGIVGDATGSWDNDVVMSYDAATHKWVAQHVTLSNGEIKFRANGTWNISWGGTDLTKLTSNGGANIAVTAGTYTIKLKPSYDGNTVAELIAE